MQGTYFPKWILSKELLMQQALKQANWCLCFLFLNA